MKTIPCTILLTSLILPATLSGSDARASKGAVPIPKQPDIAFADTTIRFTLSRESRKEQWQYQARKGTLKLTRLGNIIPTPPVYLLELKKGTMEIWRPRNGTWSQAPLDGQKQPAHPAIGFRRGAPGPAIPGGFQSGRSTLSPSAGAGRGPSTPAAVATGPGPMRGFPSPGRAWTPRGSRPANLELIPVSDAKSKTMAGATCTKHVIKMPDHGQWTLWLAERKDLPPLYLPSLRANDDPGDSGLPRVLELLRKKQRFPMMATFEDDRGTQRFDFRVESLKQSKIPSEQFRRPENLHEIRLFR